MVLMSSPWKHPVTGFYYVRKSIPAKLRHKFQGKHELKKSLGTKDPRKAKELFIPELMLIERMLGNAANSQDQYISLRQCRAYAGVWLRKALAEDDKFREMHGVPTPETRQLDERELPYDIELGLIDDLERFADKQRLVDVEIIKTLDALGIIMPDETSESYRWLVEGFLQAKHHYFRVLNGRHSGEWNEEIPFNFPEIDNSTGKISQVISETFLSDLLSAMQRESGIKDKTKDEYLASINKFIASGGPSNAELIRPDNIRHYKDLLIKEGNLSAITITKRIAAIKSVLSYALNNGLISENPASRIRLKTAKNKIDKRVPYSPKDLECIFMSRIYQDGYRPRAGGGEAAYWLPLLGLYTGARLEELGQLRIKDVQESEGVHYIELTSLADVGETLSIKSEAGHRIIPLHPDILDKGFLKFVSSQKTAGAKRLFSDLKPNRYGTLTQNWSKWWNQRFTKVELGIDDPKKVFHSFRHNFMQSCREAGIPDDIRKVLMGHSLEKDVAMTYGGWVSPEGKVYPFSPVGLFEYINRGK